MLYLWKKIPKEVFDHSHYIGKYRAAAHNICNLKFIVLKEIPSVFYNGSNYDYHFIIKELASLRGNLNVWGEMQKSTKFLLFL